MDGEARETQVVETSVVVRTFNEARHLPALFDAFDAQSYRNFEVIVVDSGSYDHTRDIAAAHADRVLRISSEDFTFGFSLNEGIRAAQGNYIVVVSAHTLPEGTDWLSRLIQPLKNDERIAMTYGRQQGVVSSRFSEAEDFDRQFGAHPRVENRNDLRANNANAAIRRGLWAVRPFDEALLGLEDIEWANHWMAQGYRVLYEPNAAILHIHEENWTQIRRRYRREALAARLMGVVGRRHIPRLFIREALRTMADLGRALLSRDNVVAQRLTVLQRFREILYFRFNKNLGALGGLLDNHPVISKSERHRLLFDRPSKAVVIHGPNQARFEDVSIPELRPSEVLIKVSHVAICATDLEVFAGSLGYFERGLSTYPIVPGHEFSGRVVATGQNVHAFEEDQAVVVEAIQNCGTCDHCRMGNTIACEDRTEVGVMGRNGAYADFVTVPAKFVHRLPDGIPLDRAALTEPLAVVLKGLRRLRSTCDFPGGSRCAVIGAGPLGHLCAKVLAHRGHTVTAFDHNAKRLALFADTGVETAETLDDLTRFNIVVEVTGNREALNHVLHGSQAGAEILLLGLPYERQDFSFEEIAAYDKAVIGSVGSTKADFSAAIDLLPSLELEPYFACTLPLAEFAEGWKQSKAGDVLKVMLVPDPDEGVRSETTGAKAVTA